MAKVIILTCITALASIAVGLPLVDHDQQNCTYQHPQTLFCQSDFAIKVKVISTVKIVVSNDLLKPIQITKYKVRVRKFYLDRSNSIRYTMWHKNVQLHLEQPIVGTKSMVTLLPNVTYVVFGTLSQDKTYLKVDHCGYYTPWHQITREQRTGLRYGYLDNCQQCSIKMCSDLRNSKKNLSSCTTKENECLWKPTIKPLPHCQLNSTQVMSTDCHAMYSTCVYHASGDKCSWSHLRAIRKCRVKQHHNHLKPTDPNKFGCH